MFKPTPQKRVLFRSTLRSLALGVLSIATILYGGFAFHPQTASAIATSSTVNFQARLEGPGGSIAPDGLYNIQFKLYTATSGGTALWTESYYDSNGATAGNDNRVQVTNGYVTVNLGSQTAFPTTINWDQDLFLTMNVGGTAQTATPTYDGEMSPRLSLTSVPYAFSAGKLAQYNTSTGFTSTLSLLQPTGGNQQFQVPNMTTAGTYNLCVQNDTACGFATSTGGTGYIQNQNALQQASTNFWISGTGRADTALQAPSFDAPTAVALNIGTTNATSITLGKTGVNTFVGGNLSVGTTLAFGAITVANGAWLTSIDAAGTGSINMFQVNANNEIQVGAALNVDGGIILPTNGGQMTLSDLPIDSTATVGTPESYTLRVGSSNALTVYGEADGSGNGQNLRVAIGSSITPGYTLDVGGDVNTTGAYRVGTTTVINASGVLQTASLTGTYGNLTGVGTLTAGIWNGTAISAGFGGTGLTSYAVGDLLYASGATTLSKLADIAAGSCLKSGGVATAPVWGACSTGVTGVTLQATTPGTPDTGNFNISGTGIAGVLQAASFDTAAAGTLTIGGINATTINIGNNAIAHTVNIGTGAASQVVTIGSVTGSSPTIIQGGTTGIDSRIASSGSFGWHVNGTLVAGIASDGSSFHNSDSSSAFVVQNAAGTSTNFIVNTIGNGISTNATGSLFVGNGGITTSGTINFNGTGATTYITPLGTNITTKINIPNYDPGAFNQVLAMGLPSTANANARAITLLDARSGAHQPTLTVLSPDESQVFGFSWDGSNTTPLLKTSASNLGISVGGTQVITLQSVAGATTAILGSAAGTDGILALTNATNSNKVSILGGVTSASYSIKLPSAIGSAGQCLTVASIATSTETLAYGSCSGAIGVTLQGSTPGTPDTGNFNITGTGIAGVLQAASFDTAATGTLTIGGTNATTINIGNNAIAHTINIGTGAASQTVTIGSITGLSPTIIQGGSTGIDNRIGPTTGSFGWHINGSLVAGINGDGTAFHQSDSTTAFTVKNQAGTSNTFQVNTIANQIGTNGTGSLTVGLGGIFTSGALSFDTTGNTSYITPLGTSINTKINVPNYDPGSFSQILAMGLPSSANVNARIITLLDGRTGASSNHQPTLAVLSPDENQYFGLSWDGSNLTPLLKTSTNSIGFSANGSQLFTLQSTAGITTALIGIAGGTAGSVTLTNATNSNNVSIVSGVTTTSYSIKLPSAIGSAGQCLTVSSIATTTETLGYGTCGAGGITLQGTTPGTPDTGNINISGTAIAAILQGDTIDSRSGTVTLNIGTTNATTGINLNQNVVVAANKSLNFSAGTGSIDQSGSTGTFKTGTGAVSLNGGTTVAANKSFTASGDALFKDATNSATAFQVQNAVGVSMLSLDTTTGNLTIGQGSLTVMGLTNPATPALATTGTTGTLAAATYYYRLSATSGAGETQAIAASPVSVTTTGTTSRNTLSWAVITGATGYKVYRSTDNTTWFVNAVSAGTTSLIDNGSTFTWSTSGSPSLFLNHTGDITTADAASINFGSNVASIRYDAAGAALVSFAGNGTQLLQGGSLIYADMINSNVHELTIAAGGATTFMNAVNSASAFQIQNAANAPLFVADTVGMTIKIGGGDVSADGSPVLLILDHSTSGSDPVGINGAMYYNESLGALRCYENNAWDYCGGISNASQGYDITEDFLTDDVSAGSLGTHSWETTSSGTGGVVRKVATDSASHPGVIEAWSGSTATGKSAVHMGDLTNANNFVVGGGETIQTSIKVPTLSDGTNSYIARFGLCDVAAADCANGIYFEYDSGTSANWRIATAQGSTRTKTTSSSAVVAATWIRLKIVLNSNATLATYYVNGTSIGTISTNIPTGTSNTTAPMFNIIKSAGTTGRGIDVDYYEIRNSMTTAR
jgi:hypothetical protein